jgi:hypothetical protein
MAVPTKRKRMAHEEGDPCVVRVCRTLTAGDIPTWRRMCPCKVAQKEVKAQECWVTATRWQRQEQKRGGRYFLRATNLEIVGDKFTSSHLNRESHRPLVHAIRDSLTS